ncbi:hypothetical protein HPP92_006607 [Vanilla planifolia]|uniref:DUF4220 domain-containing protein n=1 Tax=Vanilla planifolia TaxID=51239 RepID=A0A835R9F3_VANPL|nr:hypothetical protein HPP92_006871 [Vanilla planifolia]KAG0489744.1 hypothetical protein HPP92_006607 [Vanilla planifolia]
MVVWSNYLLANWVVDFVLGLLSSSMDDHSNKAILAFWAPFLLLYLGGPDTITAYSMEDNELWAGHLLALAYELIIVVYVLFQSLPSNLLLSPPCSYSLSPSSSTQSGLTRSTEPALTVSAAPWSFQASEVN